MNSFSHSLGPLESGAHIVVIGGGPGGVGTALALHRLAQKMKREILITVFEGKIFEGERHFNQCVGVLSPPIDRLLEQTLDVPFPHHLIQREIRDYVLHSDSRAIVLASHDPPAYSLRRVQFDNYLLEQVRSRGIRVITSRVTDIEFHGDRVIVYSESGSMEATVIVGAFGSDDGTAAVFERATAHRAPQFLSSIVTKFHPPSGFMDSFGDRIHAFLPSISAIEFAAVTPKGNHLTINIAGQDVDATWMTRFLHTPALYSVIPCLDEPKSKGDLDYFKGRFPISQAKAFVGDRYVLVGDAAGLVRPFKGKGVNSALQTGSWAARTMMTKGISSLAFRDYISACREITDDLPYGRIMRFVARAMSKRGALDSVIGLAEHDLKLRNALFDAVSAHRNYRAIMKEMADPAWATRMLRLLINLQIERAHYSQLRS